MADFRARMKDVLVDGLARPGVMLLRVREGDVATINDKIV